MSRGIKFKLWDKGHECYVPDDRYAVLNSERNDQLAICTRDWKDGKEGEIWYDHQARLEIEYYDPELIDALRIVYEELVEEGIEDEFPLSKVKQQLKKARVL